MSPTPRWTFERKCTSKLCPFHFSTKIPHGHFVDPEGNERNPPVLAVNIALVMMVRAVQCGLISVQNGKLLCLEIIDSDILDFFSRGEGRIRHHESMLINGLHYVKDIEEMHRTLRKA